MPASGMELTTMEESRDPEEGVVELLACRTDFSDTDQPAAVANSPHSALRSRALWSVAIGSFAGVLLFAVYIHISGAAQGLTAGIEDAEQLQIIDMAARTCPGTLGIPGLGQAALINTKTDAGATAADQIEVQGDTLIAHLDGRAYFGDQCVENTYDHNYYQAFPLLGNTLRYTMDLAGAGCGCNAAVYLVSMKQNPDVSTCGDYYCDANSVCGVKCTEVDIQEANMYAWRSTLHTADDRAGQGVGYGGTGDLQSSWEDGQYGPGGKCIDTMRPFQVAVAFPVNADGNLQGMKVTLTQDGSPCPLSSMISTYQADGQNGIPEISRALADGMTPVVSYWAADSMGWLDGKGPKGGACDADHADQCPDSVKVYGFAFEKGVDDSAPSAPVAAPAAVPATNSGIPQDVSAPTPTPSAAILPVPQVDDPEWATYPGKDTFAFQNVHHMSATDLVACKAYASANNVAAFVIWRGECYFRPQSGPECQGNLEDSSESTTYILRSSLAPAVSVPEIQTSALSIETQIAESTALASAGTGVRGWSQGTGVPGWSPAQSSDGTVYYYNRATGETSWSLPLK